MSQGAIVTLTKVRLIKPQILPSRLLSMCKAPDSVCCVDLSWMSDLHERMERLTPCTQTGHRIGDCLKAASHSGELHCAGAGVDAACCEQLPNRKGLPPIHLNLGKKGKQGKGDFC